MSEAEDKMNKSLSAAKAKPVALTRPAIPNVAAGISPAAHKQASQQPQPVKDAFEFDTAFKMAFIGTGQGGGRMADAFYRLGYRRCVAFNTTDMDFAGLSDSMLKLSLDVGGACKDTELARRALSGREEQVRDLLVRGWGNELDCALVCASLGGGTGSGTAPALVEIARKYMTDLGLPPRVGALVSLPPTSEGYTICRNAVSGFRALTELNVSPLIVIDNARIHALYRPTITQQHAKANDTAAALFHIFNQLAAVHSEFITFDRSELGQLLDSGLVTMGSADIKKIATPADITEAIREQLVANVLVQVDLRHGKKAACLFVGSVDVLNKLDQSFFEAGYTQLDRLMDESAGTVVHRGLYQGTDAGLQAYIMVGALPLPRERLGELARKGGLLGNGTAGSIAQFLGVQDDPRA